MATSTFYTSSSDAYLVASSANYALAHDNTVGVYGGTCLQIGQWWYAGSSQYKVYRSFIFFDTSTITDDATIISATLTLYTDSKAGVDTDFNVVIRSGMPTYPHDALVTGDYLYSHYSDDGGSINTTNCSGTVSAPNIIDLNETGLGWINKTGATKFALISSRDIDSLIPDGAEYISFKQRAGGAGTSFVAKLIVTYSSESYPSVTTQAATNIRSVGVKGNGTLTDGGVATEYSFEYGLTETPTWETPLCTNSIGEGTFYLNIDGLEPSTTYYYRAKVTNSKGTALGNWVSFTTNPLPSYGMYEDDNSPSICFYISEDDGMTWTPKFGAYTAGQADIDITKDLIRGSGKKKIKFTSNVLTGISVSVLCKVDIKAR